MTDKPADNIKIKLDKLALSIADTVSADNYLFADKLDAFKVLTAYYLGEAKVKKKNGENDKPEHGETFDAFRKSIEASGD